MGKGGKNKQTSQTYPLCVHENFILLLQGNELQTHNVQTGVQRTKVLKAFSNSKLVFDFILSCCFVCWLRGNSGAEVWTSFIIHSATIYSRQKYCSSTYFISIALDMRIVSVIPIFIIFFCIFQITLENGKCPNNTVQFNI